MIDSNNFVKIGYLVRIIFIRTLKKNRDVLVNFDMKTNYFFNNMMGQNLSLD